MKRLLIVLGILVLLAGGAYSVYQELHFRLVSTSPRNNDKKVDTVQPIILTFNRQLSDSNKASFSITPRVQGTVEINGKRLIFTPKTSYNLNSTYKVALLNPTDTDNQVTSSIDFSFTAAYVPFNSLSKAQQQEQIKRTDQLEKVQPIIQSLPHETTHYKIDYTITNDKNINLTIALYAVLNRADQLSAYHTKLKEYKQEALDYIRLKDQDPSKYPIKYLPPEAKDL